MTTKTRASTGWAVRLAAIAAVAAASGCGAVHGKSVRRLIDIQGRALDEATSQAQVWSRTEVEEQVAAMRRSVERLDAAMTSLQAAEARHGFVFGSYQNVSTKTGTDAAAFSYLVGRIYLTDQDGLSLAVKKQFADSEKALETLSRQIVDSWTRLWELQRGLAAYAERSSSIAGVDDAFVKAVVEQIPGADEQVAELLARTRSIAARLDETGAVGPGDPSVARSAVGDLVDLLERATKK